MKTVTEDVVARANHVAKTAVDTAYADAIANGRQLDPYTAYLTHKAAWAGVTGADAVRVVRKGK